MRKGLRQLLAGAVVALLAAVCVGGGVFAVSRHTPRGGTVLTYEAKAAEVSDVDRTELVKRLQLRIDQAAKSHTVVRPVAPNRVEVVIPFFDQDDGSDAVEYAREVVRHAGVLEFRILANSSDDREGIEETRRLLDLPSVQDRDELIKAAAEGRPPFATTGRFRLKAAGDQEELVGYQWVALGEDERESLGLSEQYAGVGKPFPGRDGEVHTNHLFDEVAQTRGKTYRKWRDDGYLLYSRDHDAGRPGRTVDYFYLARESPADRVTITGDVRIEAHVARDYDYKPAVYFKFLSGGEKFTALTERNRPSGEFTRQLAVILDGEVVSAPTLRDKLQGGGVVSGGFDAKSAHRLAAILNSGPLNVELKPLPVSETPLDVSATAEAVGDSVNRRAARTGVVWGVLTFVVVLAGWVTMCLLTGRRTRGR